MKIEKKDLPKGLVEFTVVVDTAEFEGFHDKAFAEVQKSVEVDGFRKGNAPEALVIKKYGEMIILEEMANFALRSAYVKAVEEYKVNPVGEPQVTITKIAKGNPLELSIVVPVMPEIALPAYKKIAKDVVTDDEKVEVSEKDINDVIDELRKGRSVQNNHEHEHVDEAKSEEDVESQQVSTQIDSKHEHGENCNHDHNEVVPAEADKEAVLPELNDEFAQSFGGEFKTLADLTSKVKENLTLEKEQKLREKRRTAIMEKLVTETKAELPEVIIESELNNMLAQMRADVTRFGGTWEEYLTHSKKTEDEIKTSWKDDAYKRAMSQILIHKIAQAEKLTATEEEVEVELVRLLATVQDADDERAKAYLYQALTNDKVLKFLEESK